MDCSEAREHLSDLDRGRLEAETAAAVRAHLAQCAACAAALEAEARLRALIRAQAPRYAAPAALRRRIHALVTESARARRSPWRAWLAAHAWTVRGLGAAVAVLALAWAGWLWLASDPVSLLAERAVAEHAEYAKETLKRPAADPESVMRELKEQVAFPLGPVFPGDAQVQLVAGMVSDLQGKRAATFVYRDGSGRYTTLFLMPEAGTAIPEKDRMPIETFRPYHRVTSGRHLLLWKQGNLACLMVSDLDQAGTASMFLKIRKAA
jgi:anti-sigma factor (TIGR02949 family)